jgi:hypothetical protein
MSEPVRARRLTDREGSRLLTVGITVACTRAGESGANLIVNGDRDGDDG